MTDHLDDILDGPIEGLDALTIGLHRDLDEFRSAAPRWCTGCGDNGILAALQRLCRDEELAPEDTVFVSGIGCSSRFPHYMRTYGFHSLHGRALPVAEGIKMRRPDLHVFVNTGDGDCCSIGTAHWIHAVRYNMDLTVLLHDNQIYGLTKKQMSPTSPVGTVSNTSPRGSVLEPLNPLTVTLGIANVSFVAQVADWRPDLMDEVVRAAYEHKGLSFVRVLQRCPNYLPTLFDELIADPRRTVRLVPAGDPALAAPDDPSDIPVRAHDACDLQAAFAAASDPRAVPIGVLFRDDTVPCYEDLRAATVEHTPESVDRVLSAELDRFTVARA